MLAVDLRGVTAVVLLDGDATALQLNAGHSLHLYMQSCKAGSQARSVLGELSLAQ